MKTFKNRTLVTEDQKKEAKFWFNMSHMYKTYHNVSDEDETVVYGKNQGAKAFGFKDYEEFREFKEFINSLND